MRHETKYYAKLQKGLMSHFRGKFYRWQDDTWGRPDFFGHDHKGRLIFVEVKLADEPLRPMQRDFFESEHNWHSVSNKYPLTLVARIYSSKPGSITKFTYARLMDWEGQEKLKDIEIDRDEVIDLA